MTAETETTPLQQDLQAAMRQGLAEQGPSAPDISQQQLQALSSTMARLLARRIGGRYVAVAEVRANRDAAVLAAFNGRNREDVMRRFGISRRLFYAIITRTTSRRNSAEI